ncbi:MAG: hypothetical protein ACHQFW_11690 [Chitinophagales bacterium]
MQQGVSEKDKLRNHHHKVFQPSFDAIACYDYAFLQQKLNYIHFNPVKAGLVLNPEEYIHSSARFYFTGEQGIYPVTHFLYTFGEAPYSDWLRYRNEFWVTLQQRLTGLIYFLMEVKTLLGHKTRIELNFNVL